MKNFLYISFLAIGFLFTQMSYADDLLESNKESNNITITIYPNPVNDVINIEVNGNYTIQLYDLVGQQVNIDALESNYLGSTKKVSYNIQNLTKGIYFVKVVDEQNKTQKMIKFNKL